MNNNIFYFFYNLAHKSYILDQVFVFFADIFPYVVVILAGLFLLFHHEVFQAESPLQVFLKKKKEILLVFFSSFLAYFSSEILKYLFHTVRPFLVLPNVQALITESSNAFPSGHSAFFSALAFSIFFLHKKAGYIFMSFAFLIGIARIIVGVHFPVDILGGLLLGAVVAFAVEKFRPQSLD